MNHELIELLDGATIEDATVVLDEESDEAVGLRLELSNGRSCYVYAIEDTLEWEEG